MGGGVAKRYIIDKEYFECKNKLEKLADADKNGTLSVEENYIMRKAMGTEKKEINYIPILDEIKKGIAYFENNN